MVGYNRKFRNRPPIDEHLIYNKGGTPKELGSLVLSLNYGGTDEWTQKEGNLTPTSRHTQKSVPGRM